MASDGEIALNRTTNPHIICRPIFQKEYSLKINLNALVPLAIASITISSALTAQSVMAQTAPATVPTKASAPAVASAAAAALAMPSGINLANADKSVSPKSDFYRHVNGKWLENTNLPADKASYGAFDELHDRTELRLRGIIEGAAKDATPTGGVRKIGDLYTSFMDEATIESNGLKPLAPEFARIEALKSKADMAQLMGVLAQEIGGEEASLPFTMYVHQDNRDSTRYVVDLQQGGIGMPDRDYYLNMKDAKLGKIRASYLGHIERMLALAGDTDAKASAKNIFALETELARAQWTKVELRDPIKGYNKIAINKLGQQVPGFAWAKYLKAASLDGKIDYLIVGQPSYLKRVAALIDKMPLPVWKQYLRWHVLNSYGALLTKAMVDENFAFKGTALYEIPENLPRWKRGIALVEGAMGEEVGKIYVAQYFSAQDKARIDELVRNLLEAFRLDIDTLDWMSATTKIAAQDKLKKIAVKIGYPAKFRDYSALTVDRNDVVANVRNAAVFEYRRNLAKLGAPIDRSEWGMTPQLVNAQYNPEMNDITFPAGILQPPFFDPKADDAANYGGIGAVIGHEISHGFDDQGAQYDGDGNLRDWWTKQDHKMFAAKTKALVKQYDGYEPLPGYHVNGALTLGENIADNSGIAVAHKAYRLSLGKTSAPVIDGLSGDQRFFFGWAQVWRDKTRDNALIALIKSNPHSPAPMRGNGAVVNQQVFYDAFNVKPGDKMYLPPAQRVLMW